MKTIPNSKNTGNVVKLEGLHYGTSLDLNMGYYHIEVNTKLKEAMYYCTALRKI